MSENYQRTRTDAEIAAKKQTPNYGSSSYFAPLVFESAEKFMVSKGRRHCVDIGPAANAEEC